MAPLRAEGLTMSRWHPGEPRLLRTPSLREATTWNTCACSTTFQWRWLVCCPAYRRCPYGMVECGEYQRIFRSMLIGLRGSEGEVADWLEQLRLQPACSCVRPASWSLFGGRCTVLPVRIRSIGRSIPGGSVSPMGRDRRITALTAQTQCSQRHHEYENGVRTVHVVGLFVIPQAAEPQQEVFESGP